MPEIFITDEGNTSEVGFDGVTEAQRVETAKAELIQEQFGEPQALILGKFKSPDALAQSYQSLESEAGRLRAELAALKAGAPPAAAPPATPPAEGATPPAEGATPPAEPPAATPPATPPAATPPATPPLEAPPGPPPEVQQRIRASLLAQTGGEEEFGKLAQWASANLPQERLDNFNASLQKGDEAAVLTSLKAIQFDMLMRQGYEPQLFGGNAVGASTVKPFASEAEATMAMNDPRYRGSNADPAYVQEVTERMAMSSIFQGH